MYSVLLLFVQIVPGQFKVAPRQVCIVPGWVLMVLGWVFVKFQFSPNFAYFTAINNIHLILYGDLHVQQALAMVANEEQYTEVLQLEFKPRDEGDEAPPQLEVSDTNLVLEAGIIKAREKHVEGEAPPSFPEQANYSTHACSSFCLDNQEQYL